MALRPPRSPEPRGSHTFVGPISSDRLNPSGVSDPLILTELQATTVKTDTLAPLNQAYVIIDATLRPNDSTTDIGWTGQSIRRLFVSNIGDSGHRVSTLFGTSGNFNGTVTITTLNSTTLTGSTINGTLGVITTVNATNITATGTVTGALRRNAAGDDIGASGSPYDKAFIDILDISAELDMNENPLHGLRTVTSTPALVDLLTHELVISDEGSSATSGRIYIKTSAGEIFGFTSTSRHTT